MRKKQLRFKHLSVVIGGKEFHFKRKDWAAAIAVAEAFKATLTVYGKEKL